jgi:hypothetical protein
LSPGPDPVVTVVALVGDLMDRSKLTAAIPDVSFARDAGGCRGASVVIVDLARNGDAIATVRDLAPEARIVGFGPHVDGDGAERARAAGADLVLPRSRFFRDPLAAITLRA